MLPLSTDRLRIRRFDPNDSRDLYEYLSLESTYIYEPGSPISMDTAKNLAKQMSEGQNFFAIELLEKQKLIGHIYLGQVEPQEFRTYEIGYIFNPNFFNQGYATEAARAVVHYCFAEKGAHRIIGNCNPENIASCRVLEKCGMTREARFRQNVAFRKDSLGNPVWTDSFQYAILETDLRRRD